MSLLRINAEAYAGTLVVGDTILLDTDWPWVKPFFHLLPGLLAKRGLRLERTGMEGWVVKTMDISPDNVFAGDEEPTKVQCRNCAADWWSCPCAAELPLVAFDAGAVQRRGAQA